MADLHIGDDVVVEATMTDANGNETTVYDVAGGIQWTSTDASKVSVTDDDADPHDAAVEVLALTEGTPVRISVSFDGDPGTGVRTVTGETEDLNVVPGEATGVQVVLKVNAV